MSPRRTTARLLQLYPASWRARYGDELQALILEMSGSERVPWRIRADVARAGGRERLRAAGLDGGGSPEARVRGGAVLVLWAWALFVIAGAAVQKTSEHWSEALPAGGHTGAWVAFDGLTGVALGTSLLVLAGIALTLPAVSRLLHDGGWPLIRRAFVVAGLLTGLTLIATAGLVVWAHQLNPSHRNGRDVLYIGGFVAWGVLCAATLGAWTAAAARTARRLTLRPSVLRAEARLAVAVAVALALMTAATVAWWASVAATAPSALTGSRGHATALVPQLVLAMVLMVAAVGLGGAGARQAARALPGLAGDG
jgi:hypothetical protein